MSTLTTGRRKRSSSSANDSKIGGDVEPPLRRARRDILSCELETIQAELEHERSLRAIDCKRFAQTKQRMQKQMEFSIEEAKDSKVLMEEMREENEHHLDQLKRAMDRTKAELRDVQEDFDEARAHFSRKELDEDPRIEILEEDIDAKSIENDALELTIGRLRSEMESLLEHQSADNISSRDEGDSVLFPGALSEARPEVLKELNRVRILLAESERKNRQYKRIAEDAQNKTKQFIEEKEQVRSVKKRVEKLETELLKSTREQESVLEKLRNWHELGVAMNSMLGPEKTSSSNSSKPPEITVLRQYLNDTKTKVVESGKNQISMKKQLEKSKEVVETLELESAKFERRVSAWNEERQDWEQRKDLYLSKIKVFKGQEDIYRREVESLRLIVKTFDALPLTKEQGMEKDELTRASAANTRLLEVSLTAVREEIDLLKEAKRGLQDDLDSSVAEKEELQKKGNIVREKFGKLRDALYAERAKVEKATERANEAEILAGKGSFNPEQTRVLHMGTNPLTAALKEEINVLRRQIEVLSNGDKKYKSCSSDVDPNKLHQRLKQSFKEQISRFREGVYLMTGYKVDMIPDNDGYKFKVRSVFAERERDHLVFQWPEGDHVTSLNILNTEHAKILTKTPSYEYMTKFHNLPAFMASVQLSLFENQTMI